MIIKKNRNLQIETSLPAQPAEQVREDFVESSVEVFDIDNFDFLQRDERRRGDRRRGYRRIDDRNLVSRAQEEAITIKEQAVQEGYNQGLSQSMGDIAQVKDALEDFFSYKDRMLKELSHDILNISVDIAETIIKREVSQDKEVLLNIIVDILKANSKNESRINLKVAPEDVELLKMSVPKLLSDTQIEAKLLVSGDENIQQGSVIVETSNGVVDANFSTQLGVLKEAFKGI